MYPVGLLQKTVAFILSLQKILLLTKGSKIDANMVYILPMVGSTIISTTSCPVPEFGGITGISVILRIFKIADGGESIPKFMFEFVEPPPINI